MQVQCGMPVFGISKMGGLRVEWLAQDNPMRPGVQSVGAKLQARRCS